MAPPSSVLSKIDKVKAGYAELVAPRDPSKASVGDVSGRVIRADLESELFQLLVSIRFFKNGSDYMNSILKAELEKFEKACDLRRKTLPSMKEWDDEVESTVLVIEATKPDPMNWTVANTEWWEGVVGQLERHIQKLSDWKTAMVTDLEKVKHVSGMWKKFLVSLCPPTQVQHNCSIGCTDETHSSKKELDVSWSNDMIVSRVAASIQALQLLKCE
jgi:hypothetical protein